MFKLYTECTKPGKPQSLFKYGTLYLVGVKYITPTQTLAKFTQAWSPTVILKQYLTCQNIVQSDSSLKKTVLSSNIII